MSSGLALRILLLCTVGGRLSPALAGRAALPRLQLSFQDLVQNKRMVFLPINASDLHSVILDEDKRRLYVAMDDNLLSANMDKITTGVKKCGEQRPPEPMETDENPEVQQDLCLFEKPRKKERLYSTELSMETSPGEESCSPDWAHPALGRGMSRRERGFKPEHGFASQKLNRLENENGIKIEKRKKERRKNDWKSRRQYADTWEPGIGKKPAKFYSEAVSRSPKERGPSPELDNRWKAQPWERKPSRQAQERKQSFCEVPFEPESNKHSNSWRTLEPSEVRTAWQQVSELPQSFQAERKANSPMCETLAKETSSYSDTINLREEKINSLKPEGSCIADSNSLSHKQQAELLLQSFKQFLELQARRQPVLPEASNSIQLEELTQDNTDLPDCESMDCTVCCVEMPS